MSPGRSRWSPRRGRAAGGGTISPAQRKRLFAIALSHGWGKTDMQAALLERFGIRRTTDIYATDYDAIVEAFEQPPAAAPRPDEDQPF